MGVLTDNDIKDLAMSTIKDQGPMKFNQIATKIQRFECFPRIMKKDKISVEGGTGIERYLMVDETGQARNVGLYEKDVTHVNDVMKKITMDWRHTNTYYAWERREMSMNNSPKKIFDLMKTRRIGALLSQAKRMEADFWSKPVDVNDKMPVAGIQYWLTRNATTGFNGGAPTGFPAGCGGLLHDNWKNYTFTYRSLSQDDFIDSVRAAMMYTDFQSPVDIPDYRKGAGQECRIYLNGVTKLALEKLARDQNDNLGADLVAMDGSVTINKSPMRWIPQLDADTTNPVYCVNWNDVYPFFLKGEYMRESEPRQLADSHTTWRVDIDTTWQIMFLNRRTQTVAYQV